MTVRVLVTGGAGFIGVHTARALLARGDDVRLLDALTQPVHEAGVAPAVPDGAELVRGDVRNAEDWARALQGVDAVVHLAAYQDYLTDFSTFFSVNAAGTALLYETIVARSLPVRRIVIASSQAVYGEGNVRCEEHGVLSPGSRSIEQLSKAQWDVRCPRCAAPTESVPTPEAWADPANAYGISKLAAERIALALGETYGIATSAFRYSIVHGAGQSPRNAYSGLLRAAAMRLRAGKPPLLFEDGRQLRDYVAIDDVVSANLIGLDHPQAPGRAYNVGGGTAWSVLEIVDALRAISGVDVEPELPGTFRVGDVRNIVSDVSLLRSLGWEPATDLRATWRAYWEWLERLAPPAEIVDRAYERMERDGVLRSATR
jgi:dTDP-L-rhamnose 4-epimerase